MLNLFRKTIFLWLLLFCPQLQADEEALNNGTAPTGEWNWIDVEGSKCGNGEQTGFAVNPGSSDEILFYLEGGGACWDEATCLLGMSKPLQIPQPALYFTQGYQKEEFENRWHPDEGVFDRTREDNPFRDATIVYVPYCTGDYHSGSVARWFPVNRKKGYFYGRKNLDLYLEKVTSWFPSPSRVTLAGGSAGGFGSQINFWRVKEAFGDTRVDLVSDSGPILWNAPLIFGGYRAWNLNAALPPNCPQCRKSLRNIYAHYSKTYPDSRFAFTTYNQDSLISVFYLLLPQLFSEEIRKLTEKTLEPLPNTKYFVTSGSFHTMLYFLDTESQPQKCKWFFIVCDPYKYDSPTRLSDWLTQMVSDDPNWESVSSIPGAEARVAQAKAKAAKAKARARAKARAKAKAKSRRSRRR